MIGYHRKVNGVRILPAEDEKALSKAIVKIFGKNNCSADLPRLFDRSRRGGAAGDPGTGGGRMNSIKGQKGRGDV